MIAERTYLKPTTISEAISIATEHQESFRYLAGGTDALVNSFQGNDNISCLIDITQIKELKKVDLGEDMLRIGALVRLSEISVHPEIRKLFPALAEAAHAVGSPLIRRTATLGGNILCENRCSFYNQSEWWRESIGFCLKCDGDICIATGGKKACFSKFISDSAPVLIALHATVEVTDNEGTRTVPLEHIYTGDGLRPRTLAPAAIISWIQIPLKDRPACAFRKLRVREAVDFTSLTAAVSLNSEGNIRIVLGGVDPGPVLVEGTLGEDWDTLVNKAVKKCRIVDNDVYSRLYRKAMIPVFLNTCFSEINGKLSNSYA